MAKCSKNQWGYRKLSPASPNKSRKHILFIAYAVFTKTDHVSVNLKDSSYLMFSDHNGIKLEINNRKIAGAFLNIWKLNTSK